MRRKDSNYISGSKSILQQPEKGEELLSKLTSNMDPSNPSTFKDTLKRTIGFLDEDFGTKMTREERTAEIQNNKNLIR